VVDYTGKSKEIDKVDATTIGATPSVLDERRRAQVRTERMLLDDLRALLTSFDGSKDDLKVLREALVALDDMFLLVVVGEFNAGKSAVINALVGETVSLEGITPTTARVTMLRYGDERGEHVVGQDTVEVLYPAAFLKAISIVDTPGTNAIVRLHEEITQRFAPRADLVLFVTSADRPFTESERQFMERLRGWGKSVVVVLNKTDLLTGPAQVQELVEFITTNARALLGFDPRVIPVSAKLATQARGIENAATRSELDRLSGFAALRRYVFETLDEESRVKLKLLNPLGVAESVAVRHEQEAAGREALLAEDRASEDAIERQLAVFHDDMERDAKARLLVIDNIIHAMNERASRFFDETMRVGRIPDLLNTSRVKALFEQDVVADSARQIDDAVKELVDWAVDAEVKLWQGVSDYLSRRRRAGDDDKMLGSVTGSSFAQDRRAMLENAVRSARTVVDRYDRTAEAAQLAASMRDSVAQTGLAAAGGLGLGAVVVAVASTAVLDITGILAGVVIAGLGFYIIPTRRRRAQKRFREQSEELRLRLTQAMSEQFARQLDGALGDIRTALSPYVRFVRAEHDRVRAFRESLASLQTQMAVLRRAVEA